jgi:hypothetical protein
LNTRLKKISPSDLALLLGLVGLIASVPIVIFAFAAIGPGRSVNLNGFVSLTFTSTLSPIWLVLAYPFLNAIGGLMSGFIIAWLYNFIARFLGGIEIRLEDDQKEP